MSRVLLVEDELLIAMMLEDKLRDLGHCVTGVAATVAGGIGMLRETDPDVAIVEFKLADGECGDLLAELRARRVPFVVVTAARIDRADARFADIDVLEKPVDMSQLLTYSTSSMAAPRTRATRELHHRCRGRFVISSRDRSSRS